MAKRILKPKANLRVFGSTPGNSASLLVLRQFYAQFGGGIVTSTDSRFLAIAAKSLSLEGEDAGLLEWTAIGSCVNQACSLLGLPTIGQADIGQSEAAVAKLSRSLDSDTLFAASSRFHGFQHAFVEMFSQLKSFGLNEEQLLDLAADTPDSFLSEKLTAISELGEATTGLLRTIGRGWNSDRIREFLASGIRVEHVLNQANLGNWLVFLDHNDPPLYWQFFLKLAELGAKVWIVSPRPLNSLFRSRAMNESQVEAEPIGAIAPLTECLFTSEVATVPLDCSAVYAPDSLTEAEFVVRSIYGLLESGLKPDEITLFVRDQDRYGPLLELSAKRFGVQLCLSRRITLESCSLVRFIKLILIACQSNDFSLIEKILRSSYSCLEAKKAYEIEKTVKELLKDRSVWDALRIYSDAEDSEPWIRYLVSWQEKVQKPCSQSEWIERLMELGSELPYISKPMNGNPNCMDANIRTRTAMIRSLSEHAIFDRIGANNATDLQEANAWIFNIWRNSDVSVPSGKDGIVVSSNAAQLAPCKVCFAMGLNVGVFPRRPRENPILSDSDLRWLNQSEIVEAQIPDSLDLAMREREELLRLCNTPSEKLVLSIDAGSEERGQIPASYIDEIERANGGINRIYLKRSQVGLPNEGAISSVDIELKNALESVKKPPSPIDFELLESREKWGWRESEIIQIKQLREAIQCPFRRFAGHKMEVWPNHFMARGEAIWMSLIELPVRSNLFNAKNPQEAHSALNHELHQMVHSHQHQLSEWEISILMKGSQRLIKGWIEREFESRESWRSDSQTIATPARLGKDLPGDMGGMKCNDRFAAAFTRGSRLIIQSYEWGAPPKWTLVGSTWSEADRAYYGSLFGLFRKQPFGLIIDSASKQTRSFVFLGRNPNEFQSVVPNSKKGLSKYVLNSDNGEGAETPLLILKELGRSIQSAMQSLKSGDIQAVPSDACKSCSFGELCRSSQEFGEAVKDEVLNDLERGTDRFE